MKKTIILIAAILGFAVAASAQPKAIGVRGAFGAEVSYQHYLGDNFIEADLGFSANLGIASRYGATIPIIATGIYDFVFPLQNGFSLYAGPGAYTGVFTYFDKEGVAKGSVDLGIAGQFGVEYNFRFPLQLSADIRPRISFLGSGFVPYDLAISARYRF